jgi:hypothetical protein
VGRHFRHHLLADPQEGVVALLYTQKFPNSYGDLADKFRVLVYQDPHGYPAVAPEAGTFR